MLVRILSLAAAVLSLTSLAPAALPPTAERAYLAVSPRFDPSAALDVVRFMQQYWRVAGNPGFNASIDHIRDRLRTAGFDGAQGRLRVDKYSGGTPGWDYDIGTVAVAGTREVLLSRERDRVSLAINSFSTPPGGLRARLVDVGQGTADAFARANVRGAVVLGDADLVRLWKEAVVARGAAGVISTQIAPYIRPPNPADFTREEQKDVLQWGSVPYEPAVRAFGFKASWRAGARMRALLEDGTVDVQVEIRSSFYEGPHRMLVAEIPGRLAPDERIVLVAHVQEPGANDNASGCATQYALAAALMSAVRSGALPQPDRTLTFLWVDELRGSRQWLKAHASHARGTQYMLGLDMTGEDTIRTGGTFLIEKQADPSAVWARPSDPHSEWGATPVKLDSLKGSLLNDLHLAVCRRRAEETGWIVRTNPYEGGSDHTVFRANGIPSLLNWHFTDRYYHTNQDTTDKVSADEMRHVGVSVATTAWLLASATDEDARAVASLIEESAHRRLALEREQGARIVASAPDRRVTEAEERAVLAAWRRWYREALDSVLRLPLSGPSDELRARVAAAQARLQ